MRKVTEQINEDAKGIDRKTVAEILEIINKGDERIAHAIREQLPQIEKAVNMIVSTIKQGGTVYLVGAGSSGRLCVLEASEIPPTFGLSPDRMVGVIAGGVEAIYSSVEAAEDDSHDAVKVLGRLGLTENDLVIGVAASGSTPFVVGALEKAGEVGAPTVGFSCNRDTMLSELSDVALEVVAGPEIVAGSTRMKAGTTQKMVLNMMTTTAMIRLGYVYDGYMVGVQSTNVKLKDRSRRIVAEITGVPYEETESLLVESGWDVRVAVLSALTGLNPRDAVRILESKTLRQALEERRDDG